MLIDLIRYLTGKKVRVVFNNYSTTKPFSTLFGFDRGTPIDRYYVGRFPSGRAGLIGGRVLEIGDSSYSRRFGGAKDGGARGAACDLPVLRSVLKS